MASPPAPELTRQLLERCSFPSPGASVVCAVSGGADSLTLLVLAVEAQLEVSAVHVDHGTRAGSAREAEVVEAAGARFGARVERRSVDVPAGPNLEARWRDARRGALPADALTGHTADDQAETVLLNLIRGSGLDGLAAMRPGRTKPLLRLRRHETQLLCRQLGLVPVEDPSNHNPTFRRARVRHELLPLLDAIAERDVAALIAREAALLREDADLLDGLAALVVPDPADARALSTAPEALARRAVRVWLTQSGLHGTHPPDAASVERVLAVARCEAAACELPGGVRVTRSGMRLAVAKSTT